MPKKTVRKRRAKATCLRQKIWQSMRIMKRFTIPDMLRTVSELSLTNAYKYFGRMEKAGIIGKVGNYVTGRSGEYQCYSLLINLGPVMPVLSFGRGTDLPQATDYEKDCEEDN